MSCKLYWFDGTSCGLFFLDACSPTLSVGVSLLRCYRLRVALQRFVLPHVLDAPSRKGVRFSRIRKHFFDSCETPSKHCLFWRNRRYCHHGFGCLFQHGHRWWLFDAAKEFCCTKRTNRWQESRREEYRGMIKPVLFPLLAMKLASLKATIVLLLILLIKSNLLRIKMSLFGTLLGLFFLASFLAATGLLTAIAGGSIFYAYQQKQTVQAWIWNWFSTLLLFMSRICRLYTWKKSFAILYSLVPISIPVHKCFLMDFVSRI